MTIAANSNNNTNIPVGDNSTKTEDWIHKDLDCGHYQKISIEIKEVNCEGCGKIVPVENQVKSVNDLPDVQRSWGGITAQVSQKKPEFSRTFSSEIVKVGKL